VLDVTDLHRLPALIDAAGDPRARTIEQPLWDGPWLFGLVLVCLVTEWALRKRAGLG
jgi:hypothetical protein